jgi:hypothetical protein
VSLRTAWLAAGLRHEQERDAGHANVRRVQNRLRTGRRCNTSSNVGPQIPSHGTRNPESLASKGYEPLFGSFHSLGLASFNQELLCPVPR